MLSDEDLHIFNPTKKRFEKDPEAILQSIRAFSQLKEGQPIGSHEYHKWPLRLVSRDVVYRMFGSWEEACRQAGIAEPPKKHLYSDKELIQHLEKAWRHYRQRPSIAQLKAYNKKVGTTITHDAYTRRWGSYPAFCLKFCAYMMGNITFDQLAERPNRNPRVNITPSLRAQVFNRDQYRCMDCGASPRLNAAVELHVHHVLPVSKGGATELNNLVTNCAECNLGKSDVIVQENPIQLTLTGEP